MYYILNEILIVVEINKTIKLLCPETHVKVFVGEHLSDT